MNYIEFTEEIIRKHAPIIAEDLGITLPEITVDKSDSDKGQYGETRYTILHIGIFSKCENANVTIFPNMLLRRPLNAKLLAKIPKVFEAMIIGILAHELRHVYQLQKETLLFTYASGSSYLETDADKYADAYLKKINHKGVLIGKMLTFIMIYIITFVSTFAISKLLLHIVKYFAGGR
jgi:hypothetical protein